MQRTPFTLEPPFSTKFFCAFLVTFPGGYQVVDLCPRDGTCIPMEYGRYALSVEYGEILSMAVYERYLQLRGDTKPRIHSDPQDLPSPVQINSQQLLAASQRNGGARVRKLQELLLAEMQKSIRTFTEAVSGGTSTGTSQHSSTLAGEIAIAMLEHCYGSSGVDDTMIEQITEVVNNILNKEAKQ